MLKTHNYVDIHWFWGQLAAEKIFFIFSSSGFRIICRCCNRGPGDVVCLRSLQKDQLTRLGGNKKYSDNCTVWLGEGLFEFHYFQSWKKGKEKYTADILMHFMRKSWMSAIEIWTCLLSSILGYFETVCQKRVSKLLLKVGWGNLLSYQRLLSECTRMKYTAGQSTFSPL